MAYNPANFGVMAYASGASMTLYAYETTDSLRDILAPNYFAKARDMVRTGDRVMVIHSTAGTIGGADVMICKIHGGAITAQLLARTVPTAAESIAA